MSEPVEKPLFALHADDDCAPHLVMMWACFKNGDLAGALDEFNRLAQDVLPKYEDNPADPEVVQGAVGCAEAMEDWGS